MPGISWEFRFFGHNSSENRSEGGQRAELPSQTQVISRFLDSLTSNQSIIMGFCLKAVLKNIVWVQSQVLPC